MKKISSKTFNRKLGNFEKIAEMLGFDAEFAAIHPIAKFRRFLVKNFKKSALNHSTGNWEKKNLVKNWKKSALKHSTGN